ncbi:GNAT family N-acetyltransferase [Vibrio tetraodonis]|uniref:GNAT family N-acetyltransferase n=1 Tax=Vibrio tetraodonis TaxID=2231647 RepID=UPI000E0A1F89|nr:GNAT family N-acetyltransferase [Vibrio tetraodonis]
MNIVEVNDSNAHVYANLYQGYGAEFSQIIDDKPNENGSFEIYPELKGNITGYLLYIDGVPAALTAIDEKSYKTYEICDFYVLPCFRRNKVGKQFISNLFELLSGSWEIKQVAGADHAVSFWRNVVSDYTSNNYVEDMYQDHKWGLVTRQCFSHRNIPQK